MDECVLVGLYVRSLFLRFRRCCATDDKGKLLTIQLRLLIDRNSIIEAVDEAFGQIEANVFVSQLSTPEEKCD